MLPGGVWSNGKRSRGYRFCEPTGALEVALIEAVTRFPTLPEQATAVLTAALTQLGESSADAATVWQLTVPDRQFLMRALAHHLDPGPHWYSANCQQCKYRFDFQLDDHQLPVFQAKEGYPFAEVTFDQKSYRIRVPTGVDQLAIATLEDVSLAQRQLAQLCMIDEPEMPLTETQVNLIEATLEALGPAITETIAAECPECQKQQALIIDPYRLLYQPNAAIFGDVCLLASRFHWSEADILALPSARRQGYVRMLDQQRGIMV